MRTEISEFQKVSFEQFHKDFINIYRDTYSADEILEKYKKIQLPTRATKGSAGYDFHSTLTIFIPSHTSAIIPTGIRVKIDENWFLGLFPRSGLGFKYRLQLDNTVGIIDSDYYYADNEGHIMIKITNDSTNDTNTLNLNEGDRAVQGIFIPHGIAMDDSVSRERNGGFGSSGK